MSSKGRVLIAQRKAGQHLSGKWEFPGGKIESGETPEECLRRELKEEFDIDTRVGAFLGASLYPYDHQTIELLAFRVVWEDGILRVREHARVKWVRIGQLAGFDFAPADIPFVEKLLNEEIALWRDDSRPTGLLQKDLFPAGNRHAFDFTGIRAIPHLTFCGHKQILFF